MVSDVRELLLDIRAVLDICFIDWRLPAALLAIVLLAETGRFLRNQD